MKTSKFLPLFAMFFTALVVFQSCSDDDEEKALPAAEFVADNTSFTNFRSWAEVAIHEGPDPALGMAHHGEDEVVTRTIYVKDNQKRGADGKFPVGTLIVKETKKDGETIEVTAMVKRGNGFNPDNSDWEWFMLAPDGKIAVMDGVEARGAKLMNGMCGQCHSQVSNKDYSFL